MIKLNDIKRLKVEVLKRVAALVWENKMDHEAMEKIPFEMITGRQPHFRCCVYREREVIVQRVRLATGRMPHGVKEEGGMIVVIPAACEGCPINRYSVTENCQKCMAKSCMEACPFGAISIGGRGAYIDPTKCKECGRCAQACPYNAIADLMRPCRRACPVNAINLSDDKVAIIDQEKCISCGNCLRACPFGAVADRSSIVPVIQHLRDGDKIAAIIAPALEGQFGPTVTMGKLKSALRQVGFTEAWEVALGADAVALHEAEELLEVAKAGGKMTTSCCPGFVNLIHRHYPQMEGLISHTVSPMTAMARFIKKQSPGTKVVFFGPCIAKKTEADAEGADYVFTTTELLALLESRNVEPENCEDSVQDASPYGKGFASSGGVAAAVLQAIAEKVGEQEGISTCQCNGALECKKSLALMASGKFTATLVEGMACEGGCVGGPVFIQQERIFKQARTKLLAAAERRTVTESLTSHGFEGVDLSRK